MTSPSRLVWISRSIVNAAAPATLVSNLTSCVWEREGASLEVRNESRNSCRFHSVTGGGDGVIDEHELSLDLCKLVSEASAVVVVSAVALDLCDGVPVVEVLPNKEVDAAVVALLDPLGVGVVSSPDGDLGGNMPIVVLVPNGTKRELLEDAVSLVLEILDAVL